MLSAYLAHNDGRARGMVCFALTATCFLVLLYAADEASADESLFSVLPAGFLRLRGCPSCIPGFGSNYDVSILSSSLKVVPAI